MKRQEKKIKTKDLIDIAESIAKEGGMPDRVWMSKEFLIKILMDGGLTKRQANRVYKNLPEEL